MKNIGDLLKGDFLKQAQELQAKMTEVQERIAAMEAEGQSGGGLVRVVLNGKGEMRRLTVDPSLLVPDEQEVLEDLIVAAHADAKTKAEAAAAEEMSKLSGVLPLPPGMKLPF